MQLLCGLEGMKAGLDVYGKVCTTADDTPTFWWSVDQLKQLCSCWEQCLYDLTASRFGQAESHKKIHFNEVRFIKAGFTYTVCVFIHVALLFDTFSY